MCQSLTTEDIVACDSITHHGSQSIAVAGFPAQTNSFTPPGGARVLEASPSSEERHHQREAKVVRALATIDDEPFSCSASSASTAASWQEDCNPRSGAFSIVMPVVESFSPAIFTNSGDSQLLPGEEEIVGMIRWLRTSRFSVLCSVTAEQLLVRRFWQLL
jgi:hypothetical protein